MPFTSYFTQDRILELRDAALAAGLHLNRAVLLGGIHPLWAGNLPSAPSPVSQLQLDLQMLNAEERLSDGTVPLVLWLKNAAASSLSAQPLAVFRRALEEISARIAGLPPLPDQAALLEMKEEVIIHQNDMVDFAFLERGAVAGRSVAKLTVPRHLDGQPDPLGKEFLGTGWLIAPDILCTNHHVLCARDRGELPPDAVSLEKQAQSMRVVFGFDSPSVQGPTARVVRRLCSDPVLDYALLRIEPAPGLPPLRICAADLVATEQHKVPVNIIQHPNGEPKKVACRNNLATRSEGTELRYFTDTDGGSSGSPVFNDAWEVVALHRGALTLAAVASFQGKSTAYVNVGTKIHAILDHLKAVSPETWAEVRPEM
jgi:hypothetical protein